MSWVLSVTSVLMLWLMGKKSKWGPRLGLANQILWVVYVLTTDQYGLLAGVIAYAVIHAINIWKWERQ